MSRVSRPWWQRAWQWFLGPGVSARRRAERLGWLRESATELRRLPTVLEESIRSEHPVFLDLAPRLAATLREAPTADWLRLQSERVAFRAEDLDRLAALPPTDRIEVLAVASLADGFVRQAVVERLSAIPGPEVLRYLMPRIGDWVAQVRQAALAPCLLRIQSVATDDLVVLRSEFGPWLSARTSPEIQRFARSLDEELRRRSDLRRLHAHPHVAVRRLAFQLRLPRVLDEPELLLVLCTDAHVALRCDVAVAAAEHATSMQPVVLERIARDPSSLVVSRFLMRLPLAAVEALAPSLRELCFARQTRVRSAACFALARVGWDPAAECRKRLAAKAPSATAGVITCLGATGTVDDASLLASWLEAESAQLSAAALVALSGLQPEAWVARALPWLGSEHAVRRRAARRVLARAPRWQWVDAVRKVAAADDPIASLHGRAVLTRCMAGARWEVVPDLLFAILRDPQQAAHQWARLDGWHRRNYARGWMKPDAATAEWLAVVWREWQANAPSPPVFAESMFPQMRTWIEAVLAARSADS